MLWPTNSFSLLEAGQLFNEQLFCSPSSFGWTPFLNRASNLVKSLSLSLFLAFLATTAQHFVCALISGGKCTRYMKIHATTSSYMCISCSQQNFWCTFLSLVFFNTFQMAHVALFLISSCYPLSIGLSIFGHILCHIFIPLNRLSVFFLQTLYGLYIALNYSLPFDRHLCGLPCAGNELC